MEDEYHWTSPSSAFPLPLPSSFLQAMVNLSQSIEDTQSTTQWYTFLSGRTSHQPGHLLIEDPEVLPPSLPPYLAPPPLPPHIHTCTFIGALTNGTEVFPPSIHKSDEWVHVCLAAITSQRAPCPVVHQVDGVLREMEA